LGGARPLLGDETGVHDFLRLDDAGRMAEDQLIFRFGGLMQVLDVPHLAAAGAVGRA